MVCRRHGCPSSFWRRHVTAAALPLHACTEKHLLGTGQHIHTAAKGGGDERVRVRLVGEAKGEDERQLGARAKARPISEPRRVSPREEDAAHGANEQCGCVIPPSVVSLSVASLIVDLIVDLNVHQEERTRPRPTNGSGGRAQVPRRVRPADTCVAREPDRLVSEIRQHSRPAGNSDGRRVERGDGEGDRFSVGDWADDWLVRGWAVAEDQRLCKGDGQRTGFHMARSHQTRLEEQMRVVEAD
mmetsp:Transcript_39898/g.90471  ORF Transcript_39898/g.90471 Transcript_39898/m.90471 type:complete len:243 (-) Transcript_39898:209-937(-)